GLVTRCGERHGQKGIGARAHCSVMASDEMDHPGLVAPEVHRCGNQHGIEPAWIGCGPRVARTYRGDLVAAARQAVRHERRDLLGLSFVRPVDEQYLHAWKNA